MAVFPAIFQLSSLDGSNGGRIDGEAAIDFSGTAVAGAGDVNGDGFDDLIIGADNGGAGAGSSYVVFGSASGIPATFDLASLDGTNGFRLDAVASGDSSGRSVSSAGDVNGDGFDDLLVGAPFADPNGMSSGSGYVVFGAAGGFSASMDLSSLDGSNGFRLNGDLIAANIGWSVSDAGDVNGDGFDDLILGSPFADHNGLNSGSSFVVFGAADGFAATMDLASLDGSNGFRLDGKGTSGYSVSGAGDVNGDGFDDVIIGAPDAAPNGTSSGSSYVLFGAAGGFAATFDLRQLDGNNGFRLDGEASFRESGQSVSGAGDINGDGFDDLIVGAPFSDPNGLSSGSSFIVFGAAGGFAPAMELSDLDGTNGFRLDGEAAFDFSGWDVSGAGDVNGDGFDDLIIGADGADFNGNRSGSSYVVFGAAGGFSASIQLSSLDGSNGFRIDGVAADDISGGAVSGAGDINNDGIDDLIVGARFADPNGSSSGSSYVILGLAPDVIAYDDEFAVGDVAAVAGNLLADNGNSADFEISAIPLSVTAINGNPALVGSMVTLASGATFTADETGAISFNTNGVYEFLPLGDTIVESFTYTISNGTETDTASVIVTVNGIDNNDVINGSDLIVSETFLGGIGNDTIDGRRGNDTLTGGTGNDILIGGDGNDSLSGNSGNDTITGGAGIDRANGGFGNDDITGDASDDVLSGDDGFDTLRGGTGDDRLNGGNDDDALFGGTNADTLFGGAGNDMLAGNAGQDLLNGDAGNDTLFGGAGSDTLIGDAGLDVLIGTAAANWMSGGTDDDTLQGRGGTDTLLGNDGDDYVTGGDGSDILSGGEGLDTLRGGTGNDSLAGNNGADLLRADAGADHLTGAGGNDTLQGNDGNDTLIGGTGSDTLRGGIGQDSLSAAAGNDLLLGDAGADTLLGGLGDDTLSGGSGDDNIFGGLGADLLKAGAGSDAVRGAAGNDTLDGGAEADRFIFVTNDGVDRIRDWEVGTDKIDFSGNSNFNSFADVQAAMTDLPAGHLRIRADANDEILLLNTQSTDLSAGDFVF